MVRRCGAMVWVVALGACGRIGFSNAIGDTRLGDARTGDAATGDAATGDARAGDAAVDALALVSDDFGRSIANSWGSADVGGAWQVFNPDSSTVSVGSGHGRVAMSSATGYADFHVAGMTARDTETRAIVSFDRVPVSGSYTATLSARWVTSGTDYRFHLDVLAGGSADILLESGSGGSYTTLATGTTTITASPNGGLALSLVATGASPTTLCGKLWLATANEPTACSVTTQDSTPALQVPGLSYLVTYDSNGSVPTVSFATFRYLRVGAQ